MKLKIIEPIPERVDDYIRIEKALDKLMREEIYLPLIKLLGKNTIQNSKQSLLEAIISGRITYSRGKFMGKLNAMITKDLKSIGAEWDKKEGVFKVPHSKLSYEVRSAISISEARFKETVRKIEKAIDALSPIEISEKLNLGDLIDKTMFQLDTDVKKSLKGITVVPDINPEMAEKIKKSYNDNMKLYIKDFTEVEIKKLRKEVSENALKGMRYENLIDPIQESYGVSKRKAKFLARQETSLYMSKLKEERYQDAGSTEYIWTCVKGSPLHPVRADHKRLDGTIQKWNSPPVTNLKSGSRNHPGCDFGCRCVAKPVIKFD